MHSGEGRGSSAAALVVGVCLLGGLALGGYFIGKGTARFRSETRTVTV
jgi:hypothetical protein